MKKTYQEIRKDITNYENIIIHECVKLNSLGIDTERLEAAIWDLAYAREDFGSILDKSFDLYLQEMGVKEGDKT